MATTLTPIESAKYNAFVNDLTSDANASRPISAGGTGGTSVATAQTALSVDNKVVYAAKSGNYTALGTDNNAVHRYTATATVTLTAAATLGVNWHYTVIADGADVTIDPNAAETIDGAATLIVSNGSSARIVCDGSAFFAEKANTVTQPFATVASAGTTNIGAATSQNVTVTGTTTITAFGTVAAGTFRRLVFSGILTLTHNATSLILPQGVNVVTAVGDSLEAVSLGSGNWRVTNYQKVNVGSGLVTSVAQSPVSSIGSFTIPLGVKRITLSFSDVSTNGTTGFAIQIGTSGGGPETSGYACATASAASSTSQFLLTNGTSVAAGIYQGSAVLTNVNANTWAFTSTVVRTDTPGWFSSSGSKTLSVGPLTEIYYKTGNGVENFDGGSFNVFHE